MKVTIKQLLEGSDALKRLGDHGVKDLTYKVFYSVGKNIRSVYHEIEAYNKNYQRIFEEFSTTLPDGSTGIPPKDAPAFNRIIEEAQAVVVDLDIRTISLTEKLIEKAEMRSADVFALEWMINFPEENETDAPPDPESENK